MKKKRRMLKPLDHYVKRGIRKSGWTDQHHLTPRSRNGTDILNNLLRMDTLRHSCWHIIFGNLTITEIIKILQRVKRMKER